MIPRALGATIGRGAIAGAIGGAVMSVSTNSEMRIRGREPSRVPAQAIERLLQIDLDKRQQERLVSIGHVAVSGALGAVRGLCSILGIATPAADAGFVLLAFAPDFVLIPALGSAPPPWRWRPVELTTSAIHHGLYAGSTIVAYRWLQRRSR